MSPVLAPPIRNGAIPPASPLYAPIADDLDAVERFFADTIASPRPALARMLDHLSHYRGKRLRPTLLLLAAHACGRVTPSHHVLGAVVEMVHTATLVHDDVLDEAAVAAACPDGQRRLGQQGEHPARRLPVHPRLPSDEHDRRCPRLRTDR